MTTTAYPGSCHCGAVQYKIKLTLPPSTDLTDSDAKTVKLYKCNCSSCHKTGMFHCRPIDATEDFILITPSVSNLGDYRCFSKMVGWHFCKTCGVRTFIVGGEWVEVDLDVGLWSGKESTGVQKVWRAKPGAPFTGIVDGKELTVPMLFVSVNAVTLEGVDLKEWYDNGWVFYANRQDEGKGIEARFREPYAGGRY
ncbi:hypothetical protein K491DRAFT_696674 [Lophiostoma macrostomum CBS 122681]|uniref:CENP-V/GFA domain-containing protein n=1 Tax=Lophiostoma macrostomum CBS 122681 TaxID=1314788 RepID=A0A6A6SVW6_9PLEO|nr:hypothetical protein K491DRAFT_696674 [Lophiostoma macrostomum CBS 122681]